jgi:putative oxidoreductase
MNFSHVMYDTACLVMRLALAVVFIAHGWQKFYVWSIEGTTERFTDMGVPFPDVAAPGVAILELVGGGLIGLGIGTRALAGALGATMVGALALVHADNGVFVNDNGFELVLMLVAGCLVVVLLGPGSVRADWLFTRRSEDDEWADSYPM